MNVTFAWEVCLEQSIAVTTTGCRISVLMCSKCASAYLDYCQPSVRHLTSSRNACDQPNGIDDTVTVGL